MIALTNLREICETKFDHPTINYPLTKDYYRNRFNKKIICEDCINEYAHIVGQELSTDIMECLTTINFEGMIKDLTGAAFDRSDEFILKFEREVDCKWIKHLLPTKFRIEVEHQAIKLAPDISEDSTIIGFVKISPIANGNPSFDLTIEIRRYDTKDKVSTTITNYVSGFVFAFLNFMSDIEIVKAMEKVTEETKPDGKKEDHPAIDTSSNYSSTCTCSSSTRCNTCKCGVSQEYYIYRNNIYCIDCMYEIVADMIIEKNLDIYAPIIDEAIVDPNSLRRSVIDAYVKKMNELWSTSGITHYVMEIHN